MILLILKFVVTFFFFLNFKIKRITHKKNTGKKKENDVDVDVLCVCARRVGVCGAACGRVVCCVWVCRRGRAHVCEGEGGFVRVFVWVRVCGFLFLFAVFFFFASLDFFVVYCFSSYFFRF